MKHQFRILMMSIIALFALNTAAAGQNVSGTWVGGCGGCGASKITLTLQQSGSKVTGRMQVDGIDNFGDGAYRVRQGSIDDGYIEFFVFGQALDGDSDSFDVKLFLSDDGKTMNGDGYYGKDFSLSFGRR